MKFLKQKNISKFSISDQTLFTNHYGRAVMGLTGGLRLPQGTTEQRPQITNDVRYPGSSTEFADGTIRYNTTTNTLEALIAGVWEVVRAPGTDTITKQTLGPADGVETIFGPLLPQFEYKYTASLDNIIVLIENVWQIAGENNSLIQDPCRVTGDVISFSANVITSSNTLLVNFVENEFYIGQEIVISDAGANDGTYTIAGINPNGSEIAVEETFTTAAEGPSVTLTGISPLLNQPYPLGYYLKFDDADIAGLPITVYYGYAN
jgi:hypothetical protein